MDTPWITVPENDNIKERKLGQKSPGLDGHSLSVLLPCQPAQSYRHRTINPAIYIALNSANTLSNTKRAVLTAPLIVTFLT